MLNQCAWVGSVSSSFLVLFLKNRKFLCLIASNIF